MKIGKFKIGDSIIITKCLHGHRLPIGTIDILDSVDEDRDTYTISDGLGGRWWFSSDEFELYDIQRQQMIELENSL